MLLHTHTHAHTHTTQNTHTHTHTHTHARTHTPQNTHTTHTHCLSCFEILYYATCRSKNAVDIESHSNAIHNHYGLVHIWPPKNVCVCMCKLAGRKPVGLSGGELRYSFIVMETEQLRLQFYLCSCFQWKGSVHFGVSEMPHHKNTYNSFICSADQGCHHRAFGGAFHPP